ncbi:MAG: hypothetical protein ACLQU1_39020 [Bryobacteraceae bacterium]
MYLFHLFRSFLPLHNPIGFGASDFLELAVAALLVALVLGRAAIEPAALRIAQRTGWSMLLLGGLAAALRLALLPHFPVPTPAGADDFSYLLLADTLAHFRLANPVHPMHQFFETNFVLQAPSYSSIYPLGPALALALGQIAFGSPWAGILLSAAAVSALCYWMLRGWTTPGWSLAGGLLAVCMFGPLSSWMNTYWGGAVSAIAGCLVFGSLPRLRDHGRTRDAILLGAGLGLQMLSRPYESLFLDLSVALFLLPLLRPAEERRKLARMAKPAALAVVPALALILLHNHAVTGSWTTLPYMLSRYRYGVPTTFTFQPNPQPHGDLAPNQWLYYQGQAAAHGDTPETVGTYLSRLAGRIGFYRFFLLPPLLLALPAFLPALLQFPFAWLGITVALFALGSNFYPYFFPHYLAAIACLLVLAAIEGMVRLSRWNVRGLAAGREAARWLLLLCGAHFLFWYGLHAMGDADVLRAMDRYQTWDAIAPEDPEGRVAINAALAGQPGKQLVFVRYWPRHGYHEWIHNAADIDQAPVVWAQDLGAGRDDDLVHYYRDRTTWLLEPDAHPPRLTPYRPPTVQFEEVR